MTRREREASTYVANQLLIQVVKVRLAYARAQGHRLNGVGVRYESSQF